MHVYCIYSYETGISVPRAEVTAYNKSCIAASLVSSTLQQILHCFVFLFLPKAGQVSLKVSGIGVAHYFTDH